MYCFQLSRSIFSLKLVGVHGKRRTNLPLPPTVAGYQHFTNPRTSSRLAAEEDFSATFSRQRLPPRYLACDAACLTWIEKMIRFCPSGSGPGNAHKWVACVRGAALPVLAERGGVRNRSFGIVEGAPLNCSFIHTHHGRSGWLSQLT